MGPKCNHMCPYRREAEGDLKQMLRGDGGMKMAEIREMQPQAKERSSY